MKQHRTLLLVGTPLFLILTACGGAGDLISGAEATLTTTPNTVAPGDPITITWGGNKLTRGKSNDFGADTSLLHGSITDKTCVSLTYHFSAYGQNGSNPEIQLDATASVTVPKSTKSVVVFGDSSVAGTNQVADFMRGITAGTVRVSGADNSLPPEDLIVFHSSTASLIAPNAWSTVVVPWLNAGKKVIVIGEDTLKAFANNNVSSIGGYFGGATGFSNGILPTEKVRSGDGLVPLSVKYRGQRVSIEAGGGHGLVGVGGSADILISSSAGTEAMVYNVPTGGRVGFLITDGVGSTGRDAYYAWALQSIARYCLDL